MPGQALTSTADSIQLAGVLFNLNLFFYGCALPVIELQFADGKVHMRSWCRRTMENNTRVTENNVREPLKRQIDANETMRRDANIMENNNRKLQLHSTMNLGKGSGAVCWLPLALPLPKITRHIFNCFAACAVCTNTVPTFQSSAALPLGTYRFSFLGPGCRVIDTEIVFGVEMHARARMLQQNMYAGSKCSIINRFLCICNVFKCLLQHSPPNSFTFMGKNAPPNGSVFFFVASYFALSTFRRLLLVCLDPSPQPSNVCQ